MSLRYQSLREFAKLSRHSDEMSSLTRAELLSADCGIRHAGHKSRIHNNVQGNRRLLLLGHVDAVLKVAIGGR